MTSKAGTKRPLASVVDDALDRMVMGDSDFIPASTWEGSRAGYYFGTGDRGTGYYRDNKAEPEKPEKKARRGVQFAEDRNETRLLVPSGEQLLKAAEERGQHVKVVDLTRKGVKVAASGLHKAIQSNELLRAKHKDDPGQYMDSEVTLYDAIVMLKSFAAEPKKLYSSLIEHEVVSNLLQLLLHPNTDVVTSVISVLLEWLDSSLLVDTTGGAFVPEVVEIATIVLQEGAEYLVGNLDHFGIEREEEDDVGRGAEDILSLVENLIEMDVMLQTSEDPSLRISPKTSSAAVLFCRDTILVPWLLQQIQDESSLKDRSLELLALVAPREDIYTALPDWSELSPRAATIIMDDSTGGGTKSTKKSEKANAKIDGVEILLQALAVYRKKQPKDDLQVDSVENICIILASCLTFSVKNVRAFVDRQGIELVMRCLKERVHAGGASLKLLDFSGPDVEHRKACERVVEAGGIKALFPLFMGRNLPEAAPGAAASKKRKRDWQRKIEESTIRAVYTLTRHLTDDSPNDAKQRLLAKFVDRARCDRLVERFLMYDKRARLAEFKFYRSDVEDSVEDKSVVQLGAMEAKLAGGGEMLHRVAAITAFACVGSKRCHSQVLEKLQAEECGIGLLRDSLEDFVGVLEEPLQITQLNGYLNHI